MQPPSRVARKNFSLLAEDENALLTREAHFRNLAIVSQQDRVVQGPGLAILPAAFAFGDDLLALLYRGFVAVDQQTIFTRLQIRFAYFCSRWNADCLADRLCENGYRQSDNRKQCHAPKKWLGFHACQFLSL
jgi:hypothetical protein